MKNDSRGTDTGKASGGHTLSEEINATVISAYLQPESSYPDGKFPEHREERVPFLAGEENMLGKV